MAAPPAAALSEGAATGASPAACASPFAAAQPMRNPVKLPGPSPSTMPERSAGRIPSPASAKSTSRRISVAWRRAPCAWAPVSAWTGPAPARRPTATLAMSVAVSMASQYPLTPTPPIGPRASASPNLPYLSRVRLFAVAQLEVPIERRRPGARALRPFDEDDRALTHHVVEPEVAGLVGDREPIAVHVIYRRVGGVVMVHQRVGRTGGERARAEPAADRLDERRLPGAELPRQPDHGRGAQRASQLLTEPVELVLAAPHGGPGPPGPS